MKEIVKKNMIVLLRNGAEIIIPVEKYDNVKQQLERRQFIEINGELINKADTSGVFNYETIENLHKRKRGRWFCDKCGSWLERMEKCGCETFKTPEYAREYCNEDGTIKINKKIK